jgi:hypothetical protein
MRKTDRLNPTKPNGLVMAGVAFIALVAIAPAAQAGTTGNGWSQSPAAPPAQAYAPQAQAEPLQTRVDRDLADRCKADPGRMMGTKICMGVVRRHPEMFGNAGGAGYGAAVPPAYAGNAMNSHSAPRTLYGAPVPPSNY